MGVEQRIYEDSIKTLNCKATAGLYGVFNDSKGLVELKQRPNICGVPYCEKCEKERHGRLMKTYKPYFDAHTKQHIRHIICTVPTIKRTELGAFINLFMDNIKRFHEKLRKSLRYPFLAMLVMEIHYQKQSQSYNCHVHYGVFSLLNIHTFRDLWCKSWGDTSLIVKYPHQKGKPIFKTRKYAFMEYATRRRVQQARMMPLTDYYLFVKGRQLFKRIGFNKVYLAKVTTIRKEQQVLPDGYTEIWLCNYDTRLRFESVEAEFRRRYSLEGSEHEDTITFKAHVSRIARSVVESMPVSQLKQEVLNTYLDKSIHGDTKVLCVNSCRCISR